MPTPWELADRAQHQLTQTVAERESIARMLAQIQEERQRIVSTALWCDLGEHAFSARDRKRTTYKIETIDEETGQPAEDTLLACGVHAAERRSSLAPRPALPKGADPQLYTEFLEWKAGLDRQESPVVPGAVD